MVRTRRKSKRRPLTEGVGLHEKIFQKNNGCWRLLRGKKTYEKRDIRRVREKTRRRGMGPKRKKKRSPPEDVKPVLW